LVSIQATTRAPAVYSSIGASSRESATAALPEFTVEPVPRPAFQKVTARCYPPSGRVRNRPTVLEGPVASDHRATVRR
jgi:hypothetical protein